MPAPMRLRSLLFAPGDSARKIEKAAASPADGVVLDLEDSVAPEGKDAARAAVAAAVPALSRPGIVIRVNPRGTPWYLLDLAAAVPAWTTCTRWIITWKLWKPRPGCRLAASACLPWSRRPRRR